MRCGFIRGAMEMFVVDVVRWKRGLGVMGECLAKAWGVYSGLPRGFDSVVMTWPCCCLSSVMAR